MRDTQDSNLPTDPFFDRRSHTRVIAPLHAYVETFSKERGVEKCLRGQVQAMSATGLSLRLPIELAVNQTITLDIDLPDLNGILRTQALVTWRQNVQQGVWEIGVRFTEMPES